MKVLFVSMHYKPEPCDTRTSQLAQDLSEMGHESTALTSFPNYPFGKIYPGFKQKICDRRTIDGVEVVRVPMIPDHSLSKKKRALSYLSFGVSASILGALFTKRPDLIWIHHPPLTTGIAGYLLSKIKRVPFVYEIHDLWPETLTGTGMVREGRITAAIRKICDFLHKRAAAIIVTSPGMRGHLTKQGVPGEKIHVFPQWAPMEATVERDEAVAVVHRLTGKFNVLFTGNLGVAQGLDTVLDAAQLLSDIPEIQIVLVGSGAEQNRLEKRAESEGIKNVRFTGQLTREGVPALIAWADGVLVHLREDPLFAMMIPSKTQLYMAAGKPLLCGVSGDAADLVEGHGAGICFEPENPQAMAAAIRKLHSMSESERRQLGSNAREGYEASCSRRTLVGRYERLFRSILGLSVPTLAVVSGEEQDVLSREAA